MLQVPRRLKTGVTSSPMRFLLRKPVAFRIRQVPAREISNVQSRWHTHTNLIPLRQRKGSGCANCVCATCSTHSFHERFPEWRRPATRFARTSSAASSREMANPPKVPIVERSRTSPLGPIGMCAPIRIPCCFRTSISSLVVQRWTGSWLRMLSRRFVDSKQSMPQNWRLVLPMRSYEGEEQG